MNENRLTNLMLVRIQHNWNSQSLIVGLQKLVISHTVKYKPATLPRNPIPKIYPKKVKKYTHKKTYKECLEDPYIYNISKLEKNLNIIVE